MRARCEALGFLQESAFHRQGESRAETLGLRRRSDLAWRKLCRGCSTGRSRARSRRARAPTRRRVQPNPAPVLTRPALLGHRQLCPTRLLSRCRRSVGRRRRLGQKFPGRRVPPPACAIGRRCAHLLPSPPGQPPVADISRPARLRPLTGTRMLYRSSRSSKCGRSIRPVHLNELQKGLGGDVKAPRRRAAVPRSSRNSARSWT